jgi:cold shock CspA family protein
MIAKICDGGQYGFVRPCDGGKDIFFHMTGYEPTKQRPRDPKEGDKILYIEDLNNKGPLASKWEFERDAGAPATAVNPRKHQMRRAPRPKDYQAPQFGKPD